MNSKRPIVLSIAGFDPSGGAGILADVKTFEQHKVLGMGVVTGLTFQNDSEFDGVTWVEANEIIKQTEVLARRFQFECVKIGMIKDLETMEQVMESQKSLAFAKRSCLREALWRSKVGGARKVKSQKVIWDPIGKASAGFQIHSSFEKEKLVSILKDIYLITPNTDEIRMLTGEQDEMKGAKELSRYCHVFLKGGHNDNNKGRDYLFTADGSVFPFRAKKISETGKHGSGCVLSSAITANLAKGGTLHRACLKGKDYATKFLLSNKTLLGYHKI